MESSLNPPTSVCLTKGVQFHGFLTSANSGVNNWHRSCGPLITAPISECTPGRQGTHWPNTGKRSFQIMTYPGLHLKTLILSPPVSNRTHYLPVDHHNYKLPHSGSLDIAPSDQLYTVRWHKVHIVDWLEKNHRCPLDINALAQNELLRSHHWSSMMNYLYFLPVDFHEDNLWALSEDLFLLCRPGWTGGSKFHRKG